MHIADRDDSRRRYVLFMMMTGAFLFTIICFSILFNGAAKRVSLSAFIDAAPSSYSGDGAEHTHSHRHGDITHIHSHPSAVHHDQAF